jgi:hypothetical protein
MLFTSAEVDFIKPRIDELINNTANVPRCCPVSVRNAPCLEAVSFCVTDQVKQGVTKHEALTTSEDDDPEAFDRLSFIDKTMDALGRNGGGNFRCAVEAAMIASCRTLVGCYY